MKTIAGGLFFFGLFCLALSFAMIGDTAIVGAMVSGVSILSSVGLWFGATEVVQVRSDVNYSPLACFAA
ncbi:hypothetical protein [Exiguobacterium aurantiacum]|uniref:Uncharacterized protein n=1 Tax=Exiguobacterium aurantiacum TaxID=33987 RepID=A0A377FRJ2_9BACL|nr:hypothetical protein [Exiguobacterium aurantiacum]STO06963.1 Uncharacterised protein [Exiguobacterium aurantiacum]